MSTTSGTYDFNLKVDEIIEEALEQVGGEFTSGVEYENAIRSLNLLLQNLMNEGYPISKIDLVSVPVSSGSTVPFSLGGQYLEVMDAVVRRNNTDYKMHRIDIWDYNALPKKTETGLPTQFAVNKRRDDLEFYPYLTPLSGDEFRLYCAERVQDVTVTADQILDINVKYLPVIVDGLAVSLAKKRQGFDPSRLAQMERSYEMKLRDVFYEDRNRSNFIIKINRGV